MRQHILMEHPEVNLRDPKEIMKTFQMSILQSTPSPLSRQILEALTIRKATSKGENILNNKEEYTRCFVPSLMIEKPTFMKANK